MLFMVIERFRNQDAPAVYRRFAARGRMMPEGLRFVDSWVAADNSRCFQLIESDAVTAIQAWVAQWQDLVEFEVVPVAPGAQTAAVLRPRD